MSGEAIDNRSSRIGSASGLGNKKATKASSKTDGGSGVQLTEMITSMPTGSPDDGAWMKWLFGIGVTIVVTLVTTVVTLVRMIEGKYRAEVIDLKEECKELRVESEACRKDREEFRVRIATLEAQIDLPHGPSTRRGK